MMASEEMDNNEANEANEASNNEANEANIVASNNEANEANAAAEDPGDESNMRLPTQLSRLPADRLQKVNESLAQLAEAGFTQIPDLGSLQKAVQSKAGKSTAMIPAEDLTSEYMNMCLWAWTPKRWSEQISKAGAIKPGGAEKEATNEAEGSTELPPIDLDKIQANFERRNQKLTPAYVDRHRGDGEAFQSHSRTWFENMKKADAELRSFVTQSLPKQAGDGPGVLFYSTPSTGFGPGLHELPKAKSGSRSKSGDAGYFGSGKRGGTVLKDASVIMLHVGDAGCNTGFGSWRHIMSDHQLDGGARPKDGTFYGRSSVHFAESVTGRYVPRAIFAGSSSSLGSVHAENIFAPTSMLQADAGNGSNFGSGESEAGNDFVEKIFDCARLQMEQADYGQGFIITHSVGEEAYLDGVFSKLLARLSSQYGKKHKYTITGVPSEGNQGDSGLSALSFDCLTQAADVVSFYDQSALMKLASSQHGLGIASPGSNETSNLVGRVVRGMTGSMRFSGSVPASEGSLSGNLMSLATNLVPYPRIHFMLPGLGGLTSEASSDFYIDGARGYAATGQASSIGSLSTALTTANRGKGKTIAMSLLCRGVQHYACMSKVMESRASRNYQFTDWSPTGFAINCYDDSASKMQGPEVLCIENHVNVADIFANWKDALVALDAPASGIEEGAKSEIMEDLAAIGKDYEEVAAESAEGEGDDEEDEY